VDGLKELVRDPRNRNVRDLELLLAEEMQEQVQRAVERIQLDDEAWPRAERGGGRIRSRRGWLNGCKEKCDFICRRNYSVR